MNFCTLFDIKYLDRALLMYESLMSTCDGAHLYVVTFDKACYTALLSIAHANMTVISYDEFEDDDLRKAKSNRSPREFFWTCSGYCIRYVIEKYGLSECTYIDSDLYFYGSVRPAVEKFIASGCDVAIISHRYSKHPENDYNARMYGIYCVQFNTFRNTENGMKILNWWIDRCLELCPGEAVDGLFGDQKYIEQFAERFEGIYEYDDFGMGLAPWNIDDYVQYGDLVENRITHEKGNIIFYHFHSLDVFPDGGSNIRVFIRPGKHDRTLVESVYIPYITKLLNKRQEISEKFALPDADKKEKGEKFHKGELWMFLTCEPNVYFLLRKIWRYIRYKKLDYIYVGNSSANLAGKDEEQLI